jgi:carboxyl-terminal processing protease
MSNFKHKITIYLPILFALVLIFGIIIGIRLVPRDTVKGNIFSVDFSKYSKVGDVLRHIKRDWVDTVNLEKLEEDAIIEILENLDPHSQYISANEFDQANEYLEGNFEGIGVQFRIEKDTAMVIIPIAGGPSDKVGVKAGDRIVIVDGDTVVGSEITSENIMKRLKGKKNTKVNIQVFRRGESQLLEFNITRGVIPTYSLDIAYMIDANIGYIKLSKFSSTTSEEFSDALSKLLNEGMTKLILDLRNNAGGYLQAAIDVADEFLVDKQLIVYTEGKNRATKYAFATKKGKFEQEPVIILIDEGSASASEIVAGAIQDNDRGIIIGRRSFGKGLVQEQITLFDGSAIRLTTARYYTPTGRSIQKPYGNGREEYFNEFHQRFVNGEVFHADSIHFDDSYSPLFKKDIARYLPRIIKLYYTRADDLKRYSLSYILLERGIKEGVFKEGINIKIVDSFLQDLMVTMHKSQRIVLLKPNEREILENIFIPYFKGLSTPKGIELMDEFFGKLEE